ncbi:putative secreted protein (type I secretion substrate) [Stella humosa]|uniref:Putative secreted protein (Type I secretion substrate) n=1 Tax=Stella humosa TaxID=94 RepID=A0A3N1M2Z4_9PROT|nr:calcium-binding protein [Stella humosa]ROQ01914.1 putative secreted protein (type I secretion substrate) [Stella humosa]BBK32303.1 hypothetical protein STHU_29370 [Stella humosa]
MGTLTAKQSINMLSGDFWFGAPDYFQIYYNAASVLFDGPGDSGAEWEGDFEVVGDDFVGGTIYSFTAYDYEGDEVFVGTGFALDAIDGYIDFLQVEDSLGLVQSFLAGDDVVIGSLAADTIVGMNGNDVVNGNGGDDDLNGNQGNDFVTGGAGQDYVRGGQGDDTVFGGGGDDWHVNGSIGNDLVYGDLGNDTVFGGQGNDQLFGGEGNDRLSGDLGQDTLTGGAGADRFVFRSGGGADRITDFAGSQGDRLELEANLNGSGIDTFAELQARMTASGEGTTIDLGGGNSLLLAGVQPAAIAADHILFF